MVRKETATISSHIQAVVMANKVNGVTLQMVWNVTKVNTRSVRGGYGQRTPPETFRYENVLSEGRLVFGLMLH
ncbi:hypothetical protein GWI33_015980 [Rhynchophorus ferrugineus]|uniref:Uncharacterized protein n=1 Tax=Rhynchophorus ferrugineus TaxID=354439 RepID=A0A834MAS1_RHYFE|nr:hypothetical protein GWI33_015980 [Rhynchophorus ferrugineus]